ncbi:hypothetical protein SLE2022_147190 [Rubroshorea leprosula]
MRAEAIRLREEVAEMEAVAEDKKNEVVFEKRRRSQLLTELLLLVAAEEALLQTLFPPKRIKPGGRIQICFYVYVCLN